MAPVKKNAVSPTPNDENLDDTYTSDLGTSNVEPDESAVQIDEMESPAKSELAAVSPILETQLDISDMKTDTDKPKAEQNLPEVTENSVTEQSEEMDSKTAVFPEAISNVVHDENPQIVSPEKTNIAPENAVSRKASPNNKTSSELPVLQIKIPRIDSPPKTNFRTVALEDEETQSETSDADEEIPEISNSSHTVDPLAVTQDTESTSTESPSKFDRKKEEILNDTQESHPSVPCTSMASTLMADDENSSSSADLTSDENDLLGLPEDVIEAHRRIALQTEIEMAQNAANRVQLDKKEKEKRYKSLMSLLGKSKEYASYMSKKLTREKEEIAKQEMKTDVLQNTTNVTPRGKRKNTRRAENTPTTKKAKADSNDLGYNPLTHYKNKMGLVVSRRQPEVLVGGNMRDYQLEGLEWMVALYKNGVNGILADEMGLGKTIQLISLLCHLREKRIYGPHLIIAPLSTLPNWIFEFTNFAPDIPVQLYHGNAEKRAVVRDEFLRKMLSKDRSQVPVLLTSYEMPLYDRKFLSAVKWCYTVVDEGHRLKNYQSQLSQELRRYKTESRMLLTGTPLQNNLTELWSLLNYLIPEIFDNLSEFEQIFDFSDLMDSEQQNKLIQQEKEEQIISKMHQILAPFLLRRLKTDVNIAIPRKKEILVHAPLTPEQEYLYKSVLDRTLIDDADPEAALDRKPIPEGEKRKRKCAANVVSYSEDWDIQDDGDYDYLPQLLSSSKAHMRRRINDGKVDWVFNLKFTVPFVMLRKIVNHPYLVKTPVFPGSRDIVVDEGLIQQSGKLLVLDALLPRLKADGHKVLLFSTFTSMLDLIEDYLILRNYKYVRLDGSSKIEDRLVSIKQFNSDPETFIFLVSTRAGGLGINLTAADTVIIYSSDWNPQADLQAQDRCHRIGQTRPVVVYRLVTAGTIDERIVNVATSKRRLEKLVVKKGIFLQKKKQETNSEEAMSVHELMELLQSTDYKQVIHPNGLVLSDEEISNLLDRSDLLNDETSTACEDQLKTMMKKNVKNEV